MADKSHKEQDLKAQSNPFATGGGGVNFETRVQSAFVILMLTGQRAPCLSSWPIEKIKLQGRYEGFATDDFIIYTKTNTEDEAKLLAQIKHSVAITEGNDTFGEVIQSAWKDFNDSSIFNCDTDSIALITGPLSAIDIENVRPLMEWARYSLNEEEFIQKVNTAKFSSAAKIAKLNVFKTHLKKANKDIDVTDKQLWLFLKKFYLLGYDLDVESGVTLSLLNSLINQNTTGDSSFLWPKIIDIVQYANQNSGTLSMANIPIEVSSLFNTKDNSQIAKDIKKLKEHGNYIIEGIHSDIGGINIRRSEYFGQLLECIDTSKLIILTGERGCGKSSLVKEFAEYAEGKAPLFCLRTEDIDKPHLHDIFVAIGLQSRIDELECYFSMIPKKYFIIESLEKLLEFENTAAFLDLMRFFNKLQGWTVIASTRDYAYQPIVFNYLQTLGINYSSLMIKEFNEYELNELSDKLSYIKPLLNNKQLKSLLQNPFFLDLANKVVNAGGHIKNTDGEKEFRLAVWNYVIQKNHDRSDGLPIRRKQTFVRIAVDRAKHMVYGVSDTGFDSDALLKLEEDSLIRRNEVTGLVYPAHDVLEDWAIEQFIEDTYQNSFGEIRKFLDDIGCEPAMSRAFRLWLHSRLRYGDNIYQFIISVLTNEKIEKHWQDEAITAILLGENTDLFLESLSGHLFEKEGELLKRFCFILRISCKVPDMDLMKQLIENSEKSHTIAPLYLKPYGDCWSTVIRFLLKNKDYISDNLFTHITALLYEWSSIINIDIELPDVSRQAGLLALFLLKRVKDSYRDNSDRKKLLGIIIKVSLSISYEFNQLLNEDIFSIPDEGRRLPYADEFCEMMLVGLETAFLCKYSPDLLIKLALYEWLGERKKRHSYDASFHKEVEECFGLYKFKRSSELFPPSGAKGPFMFLLRYHPGKALYFLLELLNTTAEKYAKSGLDSPEPTQIEIKLNDGTVIKQYCSSRLWNAYRGHSVVPYLLQSALMALENWLISYAEYTKDNTFFEWCFDYILRNSNSVMPAAVLASIAVGYPVIVGKGALPIIRTAELYDLDLSRTVQEHGENEIDWFRTGLNREPLSEMYSDERRKSALQKWRKRDLEFLVVQMQFSGLKDETIKIIDEFRSKYSLDEKWRFRFYRMDTREFKPQIDKGSNIITFTNENIESDLLEIQEKTQKQQEFNFRFLRLFNWADKALKKEKLSGDEYYADWEVALKETRALFQAVENENIYDFVRMQLGSFVKSAAVFLRDYSKKLHEEDLSWCIEIVVNTIITSAGHRDTYTMHDKIDFDGTAAAASVLSILFDFTETEEEKIEVKKILTTALTHPNREVRRQAAKGIKEYLWSRDNDFATQCVIGNIHYAYQELKMIKEHPDIYWEINGIDEEEPKTELYEKWINYIRDQLCQGTFSANIEDISFGSYSADQLFVVFSMIPNGSDNPIHVEFIKRLLILFFEAEKNKNNYHDRDNEINYELSFDFAKDFANFVLVLSKEKAQAYIKELILGCEIAPEFIKSFLIYLDYYTELQNDKPVFWNIWDGLAPKAQEIAIKIGENYNEHSKYDDRTNLIRSMLYTDTPWQKVDYENQYISYGVESITDFIKKAGKNPDVFEAMTSLMYHFPKLFFDKGLLILSQLPTDRIKFNLLYRINSVFYLEKSIHRYLMVEKTASLHREEHQACSILLNELVELASSEAYYLREHLIHSKRIIS